jgi:hypothetical protein
MQAYLNDRRGEIEIKSFDDSLVINGLPAYRVYYNNTASNPVVDYTIVDSVNDMEYSLVCRSSDEKVFNQYLPIFEEMVKSLNIL